jgi:hypothetical protein
MKSRVIDTTIGKGRQDIVYRELVMLTDKKVRIDIKSDSYDFQSHARVSVWNAAEDKWNQIDSLHYSAMQTPQGLCYRDGWNDAAHFKKDRDRLLTMAKLILSK